MYSMAFGVKKEEVIGNNIHTQMYLGSLFLNFLVLFQDLILLSMS